MYFIFTVLRVLLIDLVLSQSREPTVDDLKCSNDYDTEMMCNLKHETCNEYTIQIEKSICYFKPISCECKLHVPNGFITNNLIKAEVWRKETRLFPKDFDIDQSIKPKRPTIISVKQTENGNFRVTWDTHYTKSPFSERLCMELNYKVKGGEHNVSISGLDQTEYELVGRNLQPNSNYLIRVRVGSHYNNCSRFSEYSDLYEFRTSQSLKNILMIIIPVLCIVLILFIFTIFICYIRLKRQLWDNLPTPKIDSSFKTQIHLLSPFENEFSLIHFDNPTLDKIKNRPWTSFPKTNNRKEHHHHKRLETHAGSSQSEIVAVNSLQTSMSHNMLKNLKSTRLTAALTSEVGRFSGNSGRSLLTWSNWLYFDSALNKNFSSNKVPQKLTKSLKPVNTDFQQQELESGKTLGSAFVNENHFRSHSIASSDFLNQFNTHPLSSMGENSFPAIATDFEYGPCCSFSVSADANQAQSMCMSTDTVVVPGYQSTEQLLGPANQPEEDTPVNQEFISIHRDANLITAKSACSSNPGDVPVPGSESSTIIPADDGYQCFPGSSGQQDHAPKLKIICGPALHVSPDIQIDCSYQRV